MSEEGKGGWALVSNGRRRLFARWLRDVSVLHESHAQRNAASVSHQDLVHTLQYPFSQREDYELKSVTQDLDILCLSCCGCLLPV